MPKFETPSATNAALVAFGVGQSGNEDAWFGGEGAAHALSGDVRS